MSPNPVTSYSAVMRIIFIAATIAVFMALLALGTWQLYRMQWKEALIASIETRIATEPVALGKIEQIYSRTGDVDYWPVNVSGVFEHANERHFFATHKGFSGYYIYTPLRLADDRILFVNRGFVPFDRKEAKTRMDGQVTGHITLSGLARNRLDKKPSWAVPDNDLENNTYYWKDIDDMARQGGYDDPSRVLPFFVDADDAPNPGHLPFGGVTIIAMPNNHLQYVITWYGLAAALAGVFAVWLRRQQRPTRQ